MWYLKRHSRDQSDQIEENASDIQYILQAITGIEDRLTKLEASSDNQGIDYRIDPEPPMYKNIYPWNRI